MRKNRISIGVALLCLTSLLAGCTSQEQENITVSASRSALSSIHLVLHSSQFTMRPGPTLGAYVTLYLAQGAFLPVRTSLDGILAQQRIIEGLTSTSDEVFALLSQLGALLQVNVPEILDRSPNRVEALNAYAVSLRSTSVAADRKIEELEVEQEQQENSLRDQRRVSRELETTIRQAIREEDFHTAAALQEESTQAKVTLSNIESEREQTRDILDAYEDLLEVAVDRLNAIQKNREALIAGVTVIDVPGIEDLEILKEMRRSRNLREDTLFGEEAQ